MKTEPRPTAGVRLTLPSWLEKMLTREIVIPDRLERMRWVIGLSQGNVEHDSGGPFAAAVFETATGRLLG
ncbi:MAG TPA: nucleoside deaminase, partial [Candidatus Binatia bacterium]|nr:nucleoside deaminase [Candidatus Binatia bacterium]